MAAALLARLAMSSMSKGPGVWYTNFAPFSLHCNSHQDRGFRRLQFLSKEGEAISCLAQGALWALQVVQHLDKPCSTPGEENIAISKSMSNNLTSEDTQGWVEPSELSSMAPFTSSVAISTSTMILPDHQWTATILWNYNMVDSSTS